MKILVVVDNEPQFNIAINKDTTIGSIKKILKDYQVHIKCSHI